MTLVIFPSQGIVCNVPDRLIPKIQEAERLYDEVTDENAFEFIQAIKKKYITKSKLHLITGDLA